MSGSGSREGFGSPPWDPADPVSELEDTRAIPGRGNAGQPGQPGQPGQGEPGSGPDSGDDAGGAEQPPPARRARKRPRRRSALVELLVLGVIAVVLALIVKTYAIQAFFIPSASMENTLDIGDRVLINKLVYDFRGIHRGDIIVFDGRGSWDPSTPSSSNIFSRFGSDLEGIVGISHDSSIYIKRVIGLPGDHIQMIDGVLNINGEPVKRQRIDDFVTDDEGAVQRVKRPPFSMQNINV